MGTWFRGQAGFPRSTGRTVFATITIFLISEAALVTGLALTTGISPVLLLALNVAFLSVFIASAVCFFALAPSRSGQVGTDASTKDPLEFKIDRVVPERGLVTICAYCKSIKSEDDNWGSAESFMREHFPVEFSHAICPECSERMLIEAGVKIAEEKQSPYATYSQRP
jgi:hypothetical protein